MPFFAYFSFLAYSWNTEIILFLKKHHIESYIKLQNHDQRKAQAYKENTENYCNLHFNLNTKKEKMYSILDNYSKSNTLSISFVLFKAFLIIFFQYFFQKST